MTLVKNIKHTHTDNLLGHLVSSGFVQDQLMQQDKILNLVTQSSYKQRSLMNIFYG